MQTYTSVFLLSLGGLGDFLTRWLLWQSVRHSFPSARIGYLGLPHHGGFLRSAGLCDEIFDFNEARWALINRNPKTQIINPNPTDRVPRGGTPSGRQIPNPKYELGVSILGRRGREWAECLVGDWIGHLAEIEPFPEAGMGVSVSGYVMAQALSMGFADPGPVRIDIPLDVRAWADDFWSARGLRGRRVVAIHRGSGGQAKNWPRDRFAELSARLAARGAAVILLGGEAEENGLRAGPIERQMPAVLRVSNCALIRVAALLACCDWYVGNDSGISHLAALQGTPSTVIFGPTDPVLWAPGSGGNVTVVRRPVPCAPCPGKEMEQCAERKCLTEIGVGEILEAILLT